MNFYNPYYYVMPTATNSLGRGLFGNALRGGINWSNLLNGAQRTLGLVNQAIPLVKQAAPMVRNAKTMFKVMNEFKKVETPVNQESNENIDEENIQNISTNTDIIQTNSYGGPTFFA